MKVVGVIKVFSLFHGTSALDFKMLVRLGEGGRSLIKRSGTESTH